MPQSLLVKEPLNEITPFCILRNELLNVKQIEYLNLYCKVIEKTFFKKSNFKNRSMKKIIKKLNTATELYQEQ